MSFKDLINRGGGGMKIKGRLGARLLLGLRYLSILFVSILMNGLFARFAWAHGEIPVIIGSGKYLFVVAIVTACIFAALSREHPILSSIAGMFLGIFIGALGFSLRLRDFASASYFLKLIFPAGLLIYFIPAILIGIAIGLLFKWLRKIRIINH
jgi:hypothetical protein